MISLSFSPHIEKINNPLKITLEKLNSTKAFKITPHGYKEAKKLQPENKFSVNYIFRESFVTDKTVYGVAFYLLSENNSVWIGVGSKNADGDSTAIKADLGSENRVDITPEKYLFLHQKGIYQVKYAHIGSRLDRCLPERDIMALINR